MSATWPEFCWNCGTALEQHPRAGRPKLVCGHPLCVNVRRYWRRYGRRPPEVWFEKWAVRMGWMKPRKLPGRMRKMARQTDFLVPADSVAEDARA